MAALICQKKSKRTVVVNTFHMKTIPSKNQSSKNASGRITISIMIQFMKQCFHFLLLPLLKAGHHFFISKSTQNWRRTAPGSIRSLKVNLRIARWKNPIHGRIFTLNAASTFSPMTVDIQCKDRIHSLRDHGLSSPKIDYPKRRSQVVYGPWKLQVQSTVGHLSSMS